MGGEETGVTESTTRVWLESAYFGASSIRRTSRELGLISDSSYRFEREVDPAGVIVASQEATQLLTDLAGGQAGELRLGFAAKAQFGFDAEAAVEGIEYTATVPFRPERCFDLLGIEFPVEEIEQILTRFGLRKTDAGWQIPSFRPDLTREVDLIEEVARTIGIAALPDDDIARFAPSSPVDHQYDRTMALRRALAALGLHETRTLTLVSQKALEKKLYPLGESVRLKNPLGEDHSVLRPSLLPGLFEALQRNARHGAESIRLFEIGRVFSAQTPAITPSPSQSSATQKTSEPLGAPRTGGFQPPSDNAPQAPINASAEREFASILISGPLRPASWRTPAAATADITDIVGLVSAALGLDVHTSPTDTLPQFALAVALTVNDDLIGTAGQLWPADAREFDATAPVVFAELDLASIWKLSAQTNKRYREIPRFPAITRDIALLATHEVTHNAIEAALHSANEPLLTGVRLFDLFSDPSGQKIASDKKSLAYSLTYRSPERTLTADEVNAAHARLKERLVRDLGVQLRE
jgi:phenylalanyl-tRNA synthetase beta chain